MRNSKANETDDGYNYQFGKRIDWITSAAYSVTISVRNCSVRFVFVWQFPPQNLSFFLAVWNRLWKPKNWFCALLRLTGKFWKGVPSFNDWTLTTSVLKGKMVPSYLILSHLTCYHHYMLSRIMAFTCTTHFEMNAICGSWDLGHSLRQRKMWHKMS